MSSPPDQAARDRIAGDLDATLFVEAGAGAGKTTSLISRIQSLIEQGVAITSVAAITFTEKAAAELRVKLRRQLVAKLHDPATAEHHGAYRAALDDLDHAPIGTLHAFARRILNEFPVAAGLPPGFAVLDELESQVRFDERFEMLLDRLFAEADPADGPLAGGSVLVELCKRETFGLARGLRTVAEGFHQNWDLVDARVSRDAPPAWRPELDEVVGAATHVAQLAAGCPEGDRQTTLCSDVAQALAGLHAAPGLTWQLDALEAILKAAKSGIRGGAKANWKRREADLEELRRAHEQLHKVATAELEAAREYRKQLVGAILGNWVLDAAAERVADGLIEFQDLLVLARRLLTHDRDARRLLHARYQRLLLDEFQDTDPLQLDIALLLASDPNTEPDLEQLEPLPGRLFVVGDPKQSIYRFRRADIRQYLRAAHRIGADPVYLTANFRSSRAVIDWVNEVFAEVIVAEADVQPEYRALDVAKQGPTAHGSVRVLGAVAHTDLDGAGSADEVRSREAHDVATAICTALGEGWMVSDADAPNGLRACRPGDIAILMPARTSLPVLEQALRDRGIPYRAENSSVVYVTNEIRHLLLALRAADDATDELALVGALRTPLYGISDPELYEWKQGGGRWSIWAAPPPELAAHPVAEAIAHLRSLAERATTTSPADLLAALVDERRMLDAALDAPDARDVWRRVRFVVEQARAWSEAGGHGLRRYLRWAYLQAAEARSADTVLPEHDHDAVRVMTIHAAKGLEFPITIVSGLSTKPSPQGGYRVVWPDGTWTLAKQGDSVFDAFKPLDEEMSDAERRRLLYVACTRAIDHLVVSLHRQEPGPTARVLTSAQLLAAHGAAAAANAQPFQADVDGAAWNPPHGEASDHLDELPDDEWLRARTAAFERASRRAHVSATALAGAVEANAIDAPDDEAGLWKEPVDLDLPPWRRGRYGNAVGRAVHGTLQFCDLHGGTDIEQWAAAQCAAESIYDMEATVATLARSALGAPIVQQAATGEAHRELFVAAPVDAGDGGTVVMEGYIDLFVETPDGGVIVDYKTDQWATADERASRIAKYRRQLAAYAVALERVTGRRPVRGVLVRCRPDGPAEEIELPDWTDAITAAAEAIAALS